MKTSTHIKNARQITTHFPKLSNHLQWLTRSPGSGESPLTPSVSPTLCCPASPPPPPPAPPNRESPPGRHTAAQLHTRSVLTGLGFRVGTSACAPRPISDLQSALVGPSWASSDIAEQGNTCTSRPTALAPLGQDHIPPSPSSSHANRCPLRSLLSAALFTSR